jgi:hypothetical protein
MNSIADRANVESLMASLRAIAESELVDDVKTIDAARINLRDSEKTYASLFVAQGAPCLTLYDGLGVFRAILSLAGGMPALCFLDEKVNFRLMAYLTDGGSSELVMSDKDGNRRVAVGVYPNGGPYAVFLDADGSVIDQLPRPDHPQGIQKPGH